MAQKCHLSIKNKLSQRADFLVREKVALTHFKQQQCIWLEMSNAFDCVSQIENILKKHAKILDFLTTSNSTPTDKIIKLDRHHVSIKRNSLTFFRIQVKLVYETTLIAAIKITLKSMMESFTIATVMYSFRSSAYPKTIACLKTPSTSLISAIRNKD
jgi:hypothetical protein